MKRTKASPTRNYTVSCISWLGAFITNSNRMGGTPFAPTFEGKDGIWYHALTAEEYLFACQTSYRYLRTSLLL